MFPWFDGLSALTGHAWVVFVVLVIILWGFIVVNRLLFHLFGNSLSKTDLISLSVAGWVMPAFFVSMLTFGTAWIFNADVGKGVAIVIILLSFVFIRKRISLLSPLFFFVLLIPFIILRLAFIADLVVPSYFDSAEHYRLINSVAETYRTGILSTGFQGGGYHLGFHVLAAFISHFWRVAVIDFMLVFGQIILALIPVAFFFIVKRETESAPAAFFACLLAGFGFHMPAHLINWGKYPALLSFIAVMFVLNLAYMAYRKDQFLQRRSFYVLLGCAILVSVFIHSRTLVLFGMICIAAIITFGWNRLRHLYRMSGFVLLICLLAVELYAIQLNTTLQILLNSYIENDSWILILVLLLTIASVVRYPKPAFFLITWLVLCILCLFIPVVIPVHGNQTLLDRPFVQMFIVIPFSILGGLGLAGMTQSIKRLFPNLSLIQHFVTFLLFGVLLLNTALNYRFNASDCCRFVTRDDLAAFTWIDKNLPPEATILIASDHLQVTSFESSQALFGVDAGIWLTPLLSRRVEFAMPGILFNNASVHADLCNLGVDFIYAGGMPKSFDPKSLESQPAWYSPSFLLPSAKVYQLTGCQK